MKEWVEQVRRTGDTSRSRPNDADPVAIRLQVRDICPALLYGQVSNPALEPPDSDRLQGFTDGAYALALVFLWTDTATNGWQQVGVADDVVSTAVVLVENFLDKSRNIDLHRTTGYAGWCWAHKAALRFKQSIVRAVADGDFTKILNSLRRFLY